MDKAALAQAHINENLNGGWGTSRLRKASHQNAMFSP